MARLSEAIVDDQAGKQPISATMMRKRRSNSNNSRRSRGLEHSVSGELILYTTEDGQSRIQLRAAGGTVLVTQAEIAELFQTTPQNITSHIKAIYAEGELLAEATCKEHLQVREEGKRQVKPYAQGDIVAGQAIENLLGGAAGLDQLRTMRFGQLLTERRLADPSRFFDFADSALPVEQTRRDHEALGLGIDQSEP